MSKYSFVYTWCWDCNKPTIELNNRSNTCCASFDCDAIEYGEALEWMRRNAPPASPSPQEIDDVLNWSKSSEEERIILKAFNFFNADRYWLPKWWADNIAHNVPSYEDLCATVGVEPVYSLKTGKQWCEDEQKHVFDKDGWVDEASFENEEIPWHEFCRRMRISKARWKSKEEQMRDNRGNNVS